MIANLYGLNNSSTLTIIIKVIINYIAKSSYASARLYKRVIFPRTRFATRVSGFYYPGIRVPWKITNAYIAYDVIALQQCCDAVFLLLLVDSDGLQNAEIENLRPFRV